MISDPKNISTEGLVPTLGLEDHKTLGCCYTFQSPMPSFPLKGLSYA